MPKDIVVEQRHRATAKACWEYSDSYGEEAAVELGASMIARDEAEATAKLTAAAQAHEQAAVEAALREAASYVQGFITCDQSTGAGDWSEAEEYAKRVVKVIIDLIPASSGALDRAIAEARKQALDEAASLVEAHDHRLLNDFESCKGLEPLSHRIRALECSAKGATDEPKSGDSL